MAENYLILPSVLRQLLAWEPETGRLFWKQRDAGWFEDGIYSSARRASSWNRKHAGQEAFTSVNNKGYKAGTLLHGHMLAHRAIWACEYGRWPSLFIDHVNGNKLDNRLANLREVSHEENMRNARKYKTSARNIMGVRWRARSNKWEAWIGGEKTSGRYLGSFGTEGEAIAARLAAEASLGYHRNHGTSLPSAKG